MTEKNFASMPISELKAYYDSLSEILTKVQRRLRELALSKDLEEVSTVRLDDYLTRELSEEEVMQMGRESLKKYYTHLAQEREMASWFLRNRCMR